MILPLFFFYTIVLFCPFLLKRLSFIFDSKYSPEIRLKPIYKRQLNSIIKMQQTTRVKNEPKTEISSFSNINPKMMVGKESRQEQRVNFL